jgi:dihydroflavonol-4-reductase
MNLVTGATGHIGNVLVRQLLERGERVRALLWRGEDASPLAGLAVDTVEGDVLDPASLRAALDGIEVVYHLAGVISIMPGRNSLVHRINVEGTRNVIEAVCEMGVRRLIYTSSIHAIHRAPHGTVIDESVPFDTFNAVSTYDHSKAEASLNVLASICKGLDAVIACPTGVIGPYDFRRSELGQVILDYVSHKPQLYVDGAYDFVDVRDVARGLILTREKGCTGETYILSGEQMTVRGLLEALREITGKHIPHFRMPMKLARFAARFMPLYYRLSSARPRFTPYSLETLEGNSVISHAKARRELGYAPRALRESLADTVRWFVENRHRLSGVAG